MVLGHGHYRDLKKGHGSEAEADQGRIAGRNMPNLQINGQKICFLKEVHIYSFTNEKKNTLLIYICVHRLHV